MRSFEDIRIKPSDWAYYLYVTTLVLNGSLADTLLPGYSESLLQNLFVLASFGFAILCLFFQFHNRSSLLFFTTAAAVGAAAYLFGGWTGLLLTLLAVVLGRNTDLDKLLKMVFWQKLIVFCITVGLSLIGFLPGKEALNGIVNATAKGHTLGYTHANTFAATVGMLLLLYAAIHRDHLGVPRLLLIGAVEAVTYLLTRSRTGVIVLGLFLLAALLVRRKSIRKLAFRLAGWVLPIILLINLGMILWGIYDPSDLLYQIDNTIFSGRMVLSGVYLRTYPITAFGTYLDESLIAQATWYYALDNGYTTTLLYYGVIGFTVFLYAWHKTVMELVKKQEIILVLIAICFSIWMIYEGITLTVAGNFVFLMFGKNIRPQTNKRRLRIAW